MTNSERYLTVRILFPKAGHADNMLSAIGKVANAARRFSGLVEIGAWRDEENDRIVSISLRESKELAMKATTEMHAQFADSHGRSGSGSRPRTISV